MSVFHRGSVFRAVGRSGRCVAAARVLATATATAAQQQTASSATVAAAAASRHTSSLPPPLPLEMASTSLSSTPSAPAPSSLAPPALSTTPEDYHYPFGNPTLLISTLPSSQHASSGSAASPPVAASNTTPLPQPAEDDAASSSRAAQAATPLRHSTAAAAEGKPVRIQRPAPRARTKRTPRRAPSRPEAASAVGAKAVASVARPPVKHLADPPQQHDRAGWDGAAALEAAVVESDPDASVTAAVELSSKPLSDPIHVLGNNPRATYLAHLLAGIPHSPPVRLVLLSRARQSRWNAEGRNVRVLRGRSLLPRRNVEAEPAREAPVVYASGGGGRGRYAPQAPAQHAGLPPIQNLVVTLGCAGSINAIQKLLHRIDHRTTICLIQCGLGVAERLNALFFPDPAKRPRYVLGHMTHSLGYQDRSFTVSELKPGKLFLTTHAAAPTPRTPTTPMQTTDGGAAAVDDGRHLVHLLSVAPLLGAGGYAEGDFLRWALPSILYAAAVEPVATVLELPVDELWHNGEARALVESLLAEMVAVVRQLPETRASPALAAFVQSGALERQALRRRQQPQKHEAAALGSGYGDQDVRGRGDEESDAWHDPSTSSASASASASAAAPRGSSPAPSSSSSTTLCTMAQRVRAGRVTDIEFLNGYFVRRGRECGVACPMNEMAIRLVRAKVLINRARLRAYVPLVHDGKAPRHGSRSVVSEADFRLAEDAEPFPSPVLPQQQPAPEAAQPPRRVPAWWRLPVQSP